MARPVRGQGLAALTVDGAHQALELTRTPPGEHLYELMALSGDDLHKQPNAASSYPGGSGCSGRLPNR